ncbi:MAG: outer membrane beta-barrel protein, partial [Bacteroidetes bacterium]|nr:outer membrane beta-barrel protein [Fibrella sp.]
MKFTGLVLLGAGFVFSKASAQTQISGRIVDKITNQPVSFVSVALYRQPDSTAVSGTITDSTGSYTLPNLNAGSYKLNTFFVGYKPASIPLTLQRGQQLDLGTLTLEGDSKTLDEVQVTSQRADVVIKADRQTYRAAQFQSAAGGTATDVLRNLPGLTINAEGEVSLRGANGFLVLLNGKPVQANLGTLLSQLPANSIESIEVITTPNARFDPDGKAGIIAIVTRTGVDNGWSSQANGLLGLPSVNDFGNARSPRRYGADLTLNYRATRWDVTLSSAYTRNDIAGRRVGDVSTTIGNRFTRFPSEGERSFDRYTLTNRLAVAFLPNKQNAWNLGLYQSQRTEDRLADIFYTNTATNLSTGQTIGRIAYFNSNLVRRQGRFYTANLDYTHTFRSKATIGAGAFYEYDRLDGFTRNLNLNRADYADTLQYTLSTTERPIQNFRASVDASLPLWGGKLEGGYQYRFQDDTGDYDYRQQDGSGLPLRLIPAFTGRVAIANRIHSWYTQFGASTKKVEYTLGLRYENSVRDLVARPQNQTYSLTLNNLFPSFNLLYKPQTGLSLKAGF